MEQPIQTSEDCPYERAGFFYRLFFWFSWPLIRKGAKEELQYDSMSRPPETEQVAEVWKRLDKAWKKELQKQSTGGSPSFRCAIARAFGGFYASIGILLFIESCLRLLAPILINNLVDYFDPDTTMSRRDAYLYAGAIVMACIIQGTLGARIVLLLSRSCLKWQASTCALIYRKALRLSHTASAATSKGHIVDLVASDAVKLGWNVWFLHGFWEGPFHLTVVLAYTYYHMGPAVFTALALILVILPLEGGFAKMTAYYIQKNLKFTDERVTLMGEILGGMRVIKMYCWEKPFGKLVDTIRKQEIKYLWRSRIFSAVLLEFDTFNQRFLTASIVLVYVYTNGVLSAAKVFPMFALFNVASSSLLNQVPWGVKVWLETGVSAKRIEKFLLLEEKSEESHTDKYVNKKDGSAAVMATNLNASWSLDSIRPTLNNISFSVGKGELLIVVGEVGSGKSSLLLSVCGELPVNSGSLFCGGSIAYSPQQPWVFTSTIRQNILFGREYDAHRYETVLDACSLNKDLSVLPHKDLTLVGEKGVTLSGGQKARVGLARALYADASVYLLDDPLSAVDPQVGKELFEKCIAGPLMSNKAVILVTHQLQYLQDSDKILVLHEGEPQAYGCFQSLLDSGIDFAKLLPAIEEECGSDNKRRTRTVSETRSFEDDLDDLKKQVAQHEGEKREEEDRAVGTVSWRIYWEYFTAQGSICALFCWLFLCLLTQVAYNAGDWWLTVWSTTDTAQENANGSFHCNQTMPWECLDTYTSSYIFIVMVVLMFIIGITRSWTFFHMSMKSSIRLHNKMYTAVVRAPIRFCDTNPKGRIINRFSADISSMDSDIPEIIEMFLQNFSAVVGSVVVMIILNPFVAIATLPLMISIIWVRNNYLKSTRQIMRLASAGNSPILTHMNASLDGIHTIRAFNVQPRLIHDFEQHYSAMCGAWFSNMGVVGWFQYHINLIAALFNAGATFACMLAVDYKMYAMSPSEMGLVMSYVTSLVWAVESAVRLSSETEIQMVKAERVIRYTNIEPEAALTNQEMAPPPTWPSEGRITFDHVSFAYASETPLVLKNIFCDIQPGEKIGIAGRTGSGKSSFVQCLFRMAEPIGEIRIDGFPVNDLGLHDVRGNIAIIPQDPVLFSGNVRKNLDPFEVFEDDQLWKVLEEVQLKPAISEMPGGLEASVSEGGNNLSVGQKQLFCLARAILRKNRILIMDEATANVDKKTAALIQQTIREKFAECTVLTIAHRLHTIMDSDRIMVFDNGELVEFDIPFRLLQNRKGLFFSMVEQSGESEQQRLIEMAEQAFFQTVNVNLT